MEKTKLEEFRVRLLAEKAKLLAELEQIELDIRENTQDQYLEGTSDSDAAADVSEQEHSLMEQNYLRHNLKQVEQALERIEKGTYGLSEISGKPIPLERLEALPWAACLVEEARAR
jgi:DnaK suppressor protein